MDVVVHIMIYAGSLLMVFNIWRYYRFLGRMLNIRGWRGNAGVLYVPLALLIFFLLGYLFVGIVGNPDLVMAGILFGGSVFVAIILSVMFEITRRLSESGARAEALYAELRGGVDNLAKDYLAVFFVNLTQDEIEDRVGQMLYASDLHAASYSELMEFRSRHLLSDPEMVDGWGLFSREGLLRSFELGHTSVEERVLCIREHGSLYFAQLSAELAVNPESGDVMACITEALCDDELVNEALLGKALAGQYDMIASIMDGRYKVVIGGPTSMTGGGLFPSVSIGEFVEYVKSRIIPVLHGTSEEREEVIHALQPSVIERELRLSEPYEVNLAVDVEGETFYKRLVFYIVDSKARFHLLLMSDTTDARREEMERNLQLSEALEASERASNAKTTFLSNVSHDIRTPMNAIVGYTEFARRSKTLNEAQAYLEKIESSSKYMLALVNDVLEMSRIESGRMDLVLEPTDLQDVMDGLRDMFGTQMAEKDLTYRVETSVRDAWVLCDSNRLNRVLLNLLSNAYKFTPPGGSVTVTLQQIGDEGLAEGQMASQGKDSGGPLACYELRVRDTGIGMSPAFAEKVFEAFERERTDVVASIQGTGLGMAIAKHIVTLMDGVIDVSSEEGVGTEFVVRVCFEVLGDTAGESGDIVAHKTVDVENVDFCGMRVLVVEDNDINREIAHLLLEDAGFLVDEAVNGREGVDMLIAGGPGHYDLVITDIRMPVMNGYEETRAIRALPDLRLARVPIVAMSANAFAEDIEIARQAGINGYVSKPINLDELESTLACVLAKSR